MTDERARRIWIPTIYKRLRRTGYEGNFVGLTWSGDEQTGGNWPPASWVYDLNVQNALESAEGMAQALNFIHSTSAGKSTVLAHSLGNMVVSSAIVDYNAAPSLYIMAQAAVPAGAYSSSQEMYLRPGAFGIRNAERTGVPRLDVSQQFIVGSANGQSVTFGAGRLNLLPWECAYHTWSPDGSVEAIELRPADAPWYGYFEDLMYRDGTVVLNTWSEHDLILGGLGWVRGDSEKSEIKNYPPVSSEPWPLDGYGRYAGLTNELVAMNGRQIEQYWLSHVVPGRSLPAGKEPVAFPQGNFENMDVGDSGVSRYHHNLLTTNWSRFTGNDKGEPHSGLRAFPFWHIGPFWNRMHDRIINRESQ